MLRSLKNKYLLLLWFWHLYLLFKGKFDLIWFSDREAINRLYYKYCKRLPNLEAPVSFSEKQQQYKLEAKNVAAMVRCANKFTAREYIKGKGFGHILNDLYYHYDKVNDINLDLLPNQFVLKASHGSGWNFIIKNKDIKFWFLRKAIMRLWLLDNIFWQGREVSYLNSNPGIVCEKYLNSNGLDDIIDYKIFCFNGKPEFIQCNVGRNSENHVQNFYTLDWQLLPFGKDLEPCTDFKIAAPDRLGNMIEIATALSEEFEFVRVDLFEIESRVVFSELTFFPKSGLPDFIPSKYDLVVGELWAKN